MRFYDILVTNADGSQYQRWTSQINGYNDPGAPQVEVELFETNFATPLGDSTVTIWGVDLSLLLQASDFNGKGITVSVGMMSGLPLANPAQQGVVSIGTIKQAIGTWQGTEMRLDLFITATGASLDTPANLVLDWKAGTPLAQALAQSFTTAFPKFKQAISISPKLVLPHDEVHYCATLAQFAQFIQTVTAGIVASGYQGVQVTQQGTTLVAYDNTTPGTPKQLLATDLVGQPTWQDAGTAIVNTVLRGDIHVGDYIKMPLGFVAGPGSLTTAPNNNTQYTNTIGFQGSMQVNMIRHIGHSRDPNGTNWVSLFVCSLPG